MVRYGAERVLPSVNSRSGEGSPKASQRGGCEQANKRTNEQGRSGVFVFVRVRFCSLCSLCSLLFGLFGFVRLVRFCSVCFFDGNGQRGV